MPSSEMDAYAKLKVGDCQQEVSSFVCFNRASSLLRTSLLASKWFSSAGMLFIALEQRHLRISHAPNMIVICHGSPASHCTGPLHGPCAPLASSQRRELQEDVGAGPGDS